MQGSFITANPQVTDKSNCANKTLVICRVVELLLKIFQLAYVLFII